MTTIIENVSSSFALGQEQVQFYQREGYLVLPEALSAQEVEALRGETTRICRGELGEFPGLSVSDPSEDAAESLKRYLCIHFPHKISELMFDFLAHPKIVQVLTQLIGPDVKCMQSMLFIKAAGKPGQAWHQDEYFIPTRDRSLAGAWLALDDATTENGCLWVLPGSHRPGVLYPQHQHNDRRFDCTGEAYHFPYSDDQAIPVEVKAGTIVFFNGYLLHRSLPNRATSGYRRTLVNHYMSANSLLPWAKPTGESDGMLDFRDIIMVAGTDPYAYKGTISYHQPHVRPSGEGGCESPKPK